MKSNYHPKNIKAMAELTILGVFSANLIAPLIALYLLYDFLSHTQLFIWVGLHFIIFTGRIVLAKILLRLLAKNSVKVPLVLNISLTLTSFTALLYAFIVWSSVINGIPDLHIFMVAMIIVSLSAGAISTLINVLHAFVLYVTLSVFPLIGAILYRGDEIFNIFALLLFIFVITVLKAGHKQYNTLNEAISLKETFETIYNKSSDGIALIKNNRFLDFNEAIVNMFQYNSKEELLNTHLSKLMPKFQEDGTLSVKKMLKISIATMKEGNHSFEWLYTKSNGTMFWTEIVLTKIYLDGEELLHGTWRDISIRKQFEKNQLLEQQSRLAQMGEVISMIAHQWRQPLTAISAISSAINLKTQLGNLTKQEILDLSNNITEHSHHLSDTIDDFREFFKPNKEKSDTSFNELIDSVLGIVEVSITAEDITILKDLNCDDRFTTYPNEIKQVILNLLKNAEDVLIENKIENPTIKIATYSQDNYYILELSDNAGGVPKNIIDDIFNPYFSTKTQKDGTGLGLYMSKTIVEEHCNGKLTVHNENDGAVFRIKLPITQAEISV